MRVCADALYAGEVADLPRHLHLRHPSSLVPVYMQLDPGSGLMDGEIYKGESGPVLCTQHDEQGLGMQCG